jgi:beta-lactamase class A
MELIMRRPTSFIQTSFQKFPLYSFIIFAIFFFFLGWIGSLKFVALKVPSVTASSTLPSLRLGQTQYSLINPLLLCSVDANVSSIDNPLKQKVTDFINGRIAAGQATNMSVYIQEYGKNKWVGVNENEQYNPASLLKVPLMIAYLQISEKDPTILSQETSFTGTDQNIGEYFKSPNDIKADTSYSIEDLIESMIINSDNTAEILLLNYAPKSSILSVYTDLGLPTPPDDPTVQYISAKSYASFFRVLYNATYLNRADSEKAMEFLSKGHLPNGIKSAVPSNITVADKFGERTVYDQSNNVVDRELHDCGIVYIPNTPYLLCVMSRGGDFTQLAQNIHDLSSLVYSNIIK